jgi:hypothetical protein
VTTKLSMIWDGDGIHTARCRLEDGGKTLTAEEGFRGPWRFDTLWVAVRT